MLDLQSFYGPNAGYVLELYERYRKDPASVDAATRAIFDSWSPDNLVQTRASQSALSATEVTRTIPFSVSHVVAASALAHSIRERDRKSTRLNSSHMSISYA